MKNDKKRNIIYEKRPFAAQATRVLLGKNRIAVDENLKGGPRALSRAPSSARGRLPAVPQRSFKSNAVFWRMLIKFLRKLLDFARMIFNFVNFVKTYRIRQIFIDSSAACARRRRRPRVLHEEPRPGLGVRSGS